MENLSNDSQLNDSQAFVPPLVWLFLEDLAVTSALRLGRALKSNEISTDGVSLSRAAIAEGLKHSTRLSHGEREWNLAVRASRQHLAREERDRQPLETTLNGLLIALGKPLPLPVIARELTFLRGAFQPSFQDLAAGALRHARWAVEVAPNIWIHEAYLLDAHAPSLEIIARVNGLEDDLDFEELSTLALPDPTGNLSDDAVAVLRLANRPIPLKLLGFLLLKNNPQLDPKALARATFDRAKFYWFAGGYICLQEYLPRLKNEVSSWAREQGGAASHVDVAAILRQRNIQGTAREIKPEMLEDLKAVARKSSGQPVSLALVMSDVLEIEPDDPSFAPTLQALNDRLRSDTEFLPVGIGQYLLRASIPSHVGETPAILRPTQVAVTNPETDEPLDFEMSDDGLEGDAADFVHDPNWDDIGEEAEVKLLRRPQGESTPTVRYVILNHHHRAGTMKLRRMDEEFFGVGSAFTSIKLSAENQTLQAWASRESGLIYGLGDWFQERTPASGGVLQFAREGNSIALKLDAPDKLTLLEGHRYEELESLRDAANYMSLYELLQNIMREHGGGMELSTLWAEVNVVRRTTKRLLVSVLSGYHCYYFKQRGPKQILWRFDADRLDQGFKRNKRKYVRR